MRVKNNRFISDEEGRFGCVFCDHRFRLDEMKNDLSRKEAGISGLCQTCQDETFGPDDEEEAA